MARKIPIFNMNNEKAGDVSLPALFDEPYRPDLISRVVLSIESNMRQPYGSDIIAGQKVSAKLSRRRRDYKGSYGHGISRVPRKIVSRNGTRMNWVGALAPGTVKGRRAHPPKISKDWSQTVSTQEKKKGTKSALAATMNKGIVVSRGHRLPSTFPFIIEDSFESIKTTKEIVGALQTLGFAEELQRAIPSTRAGRGKMRGRATVIPRTILFVISTPSPLILAARNIPGVEVVLAKDVNAKHLAPGCHPGRLTLYTQAALNVLESRFSGEMAADASLGKKAMASEKHSAIKAEKPAKKAVAHAKKSTPSTEKKAKAPKAPKASGAKKVDSQ